MPQGDKGAYTDKQTRKAAHIEGYQDRDVSKKEAAARPWAAVNKGYGGGNRSGSDRGKPYSHVSSARGVKASKSGSVEQHSAAARKGWVRRRKNQAS